MKTNTKSKLFWEGLSVFVRIGIKYIVSTGNSFGLYEHDEGLSGPSRRPDVGQERGKGGTH